MNPPQRHFCAIVAMASNRVIGRNGGLPWHYPEDLQHFKRITLGSPIVMGRSTYESIGRPLPGRQNIVITRQPTLPGDVTVIPSLKALADLPLSADRVFIIGGAQLFQEALPLCEELYLTFIRPAIEGDVWMPPFESEFNLVEARPGQHPDLEFRHYKRRDSSNDRTDAN